MSKEHETVTMQLNSYLYFSCQDVAYQLRGLGLLLGKYNTRDGIGVKDEDCYHGLGVLLDSLATQLKRIAELINTPIDLHSEVKYDHYEETMRQVEKQVIELELCKRQLMKGRPE